MQMTTRRRFSDKFKATVALEALRGDRTVQQIAAKHRLQDAQHRQVMFFIEWQHFVVQHIPRDRDGSFDPELVKKGQTRIDGM